ncbi:cytochrome c oxidase subunit 8A, mitochondrial-like [Solea senegalensis]|uniref:Cytochrome c oxidase subunit 8A, mitochondrial-like n=1 Tax=Solea senegalensis TaxID=28829 RepID=A0AAV6S234_SOLSE|nr:cytochrome c oxidase subunit 8A, mitochondrial-like [Solea senegalensis]
MFSVLQAPALTRSMLLRAIQQGHRSMICSKPPKEEIGPAQSVFAMCVIALSLLAPAGWIMYHLPEYRRRPTTQR